MTTSPVAPETTTPAISPDHILQTGLAFWASKTLLSAVEMEVFTELARGPETLEALTGRLGLHPRSARDFLDALVALGFLAARDGHTRNTPSSELFLDKRKPSYIGGILEMANHRLYPFWGHLTDGAAHRRSRRTRPNPASPGPLRAALRRSRPPQGLPRGDDRHQPRRQHGHRRQFPWDEYKTFADIGTAQGDLVVAGRARESAPHRHRLRPARSRAHLRGVRRRTTASPIASALPARQLLQRPPAQGRRRHDGPHPARLGSADEADARSARPTKRSPQAAPSSSTTPSSTTTDRRTPSAC